MNYNEAIDFIKNTYKFGSKLGLDNMRRLLNLLENPQEKLSIIHIAGTNGKGSTCAFLNSVLQEGGYKVGLYTSPSMEGFTGRIKVNNENIEEERFASIAKLVKEKINTVILDGGEHPTEFEIITAMAFQYFLEEGVDFVVLEVGLGGRLDATNIIKAPIMSIITPIGYDHMEYLGETLDKIAYEKAGIIKANIPVVSAPQESAAMHVIERVGREKNSEPERINLDSLIIHESSLLGQQFTVKVFNEEYSRVNISLLGEHQIENACLVLTAIEKLKSLGKIKMSKETIYKGLQRAHWPGRFEIIRNSPLTIIDGAHNVHAAARLRQAMKSMLRDKEIILVIGMLGDKDINGVLDLVVPLCNDIVVTTPRNSRALPAKELEALIKRHNTKTHVCIAVKEALRKAYELCNNDNVILVTGSLYLIEEARKILIE